MHHQVRAVLFTISIVSAVPFAALARQSTPAPPSPVSSPTERICGWFENPTPANAFLRDRDREWIIGFQGGYQSEGPWPEFDDDEWVKTNIHYGYGCACLDATLDNEKDRVVRISKAFSQPLVTCRGDKAIKHHEPRT